ncbi:LptA/OstA family protein [Leptolyngbya sp. FACHB-261]|uniref:LptA/OstA family protein n=1 Tax=Leptolyngbya sp. FACHB-261 TaxID=2692806 RepID=UPI001685966F|nr:LptA/OstA family protein [Leptolyngbya sp. FACHB-261]MBD2103829.1 hypothetical protein [Leptolyngbya sp. FACHB-261]
MRVLLGLVLLPVGLLLGGPLAAQNTAPRPAQRAAAPSSGRAVSILADVQEANAVTGVVTARGNVRMNYPARQIQATSDQAQYFSRERRIVLTGDVYINQAGNSLRGERVVYLIDQGRFEALPQTNQQVESIYLVPDAAPVTAQPSSSNAQPFDPKRELKP